MGTGIDSLSRTAFCECENLNTVVCRADTTPVFFGNSIYSYFGGCGHQINELKVHCGSTSSYSSWASYFNQISCYYIMTVQANNDNWGTVSGDNYITYGDTANIIATASYGYHFVEWNDHDTCNPRSVELSRDTSFTAIFSINQYTLSVSSNDTSFGHVSEGGIFEHGQTVTVHATPQPHHHFVQWSDGNMNNPRTVTVIHDMELTAYFAIDQHQVTVNTNNQTWGTVTGTGTFDYGSNVTLTATPTDAYHYFSTWSDGNNTTTRTITVTSDTSFTAYFGLMQYTVIATSSNPAMGFVTGDGVYDYGSTATVTAHPHSGFRFLNWNDGSADSTRNLTVTQDMELVAYFGQQQGVDDAEENNRICLYPNPACEMVTLQVHPNVGTVQLTVTDLLGRELLRLQSQDEEVVIPVRQWTEGVYMLKASFEDGTTAVRKIIVK